MKYLIVATVLIGLVSVVGAARVTRERQLLHQQIDKFDKSKELNHELLEAKRQSFPCTIELQVTNGDNQFSFWVFRNRFNLDQKTYIELSYLDAEAKIEIAELDVWLGTKDEPRQIELGKIVEGDNQIGMVFSDNKDYSTFEWVSIYRDQKQLSLGTCQQNIIDKEDQ